MCDKNRLPYRQDEDTEETSRAAALLRQHYGLTLHSASKINRGSTSVLRVHTSLGSFVLKLYKSSLQTVHRSLRGNKQAASWGLPIAEEVANLEGELVTETPSGYYVLYRFLEGRTLEEGTFSLRAAASFGHIIAVLQRAMREIDAAGLVGDHRWEISIAGGLKRLESILQQAEKGCHPLDPLTAAFLRDQIRLYEEHSTLMTPVETLPVQWVHGDANPGNFLFGPDDQVVGVLDFDNVSYLPRGFDFMYAMAQSFPQPGPQLEQALWAYFEELRPSRWEVTAYPSMWLFALLMNIWPMDSLDANPKEYEQTWREYQADIHQWIILLPQMIDFFADVYDRWQQAG